MSSSIVRHPARQENQFSRSYQSASGSVAGGRKYNEDRCFRCDECYFYLVVDGMGGHRGGALASQIAVEKIPQEFHHRFADSYLSHVGIQAAFYDSVLETASEMEAVAREHPGYGQMGCTLGVAIMLGSRLYFGNVGDCRVYRMHRRRLTLLTKDQTLVQGLVDNGLLNPESARTHRWRNIVTNSVSARGLQQAPSLSWKKLSHGDRILVTSDGLADALLDHQIESIMARTVDPESCVTQLIEGALDHQARDNVSCVVVDH